MLLVPARGLDNPESTGLTCPILGGAPLACPRWPRAWRHYVGAKDNSRCAHGRDPAACSVLCLARLLPRGANGDDHNRSCPCHDDRRASLSINPGDVVRIVWHCGAGCDPEDVRAELEALGAAESCLGTYGQSKRAIVPGMRIAGHDPALVADVKRWHAVLKLPSDLAGHLYKMCVQAIAEGDGDLPGDPFRLLPETKPEFIAAARRCGFERSYCRKLWLRWSEELAHHPAQP